MKVIARSFSANAVQLGVRTGLCVLPHPDKAHKGGEDAYFISNPRAGVSFAGGGGMGWRGDNTTIIVGQQLSPRYSGRTTPPSMFTRYQTQSQTAPRSRVKEDSAATVLGIADGVSGWAGHGVNPAAYASELMVAGHDAVTSNPKLSDPLAILEAAYKKTLEVGVRGSSTACIFSLHDNTLRCCNLGDSAMMIIRGGKLLYRSKEQVHGFNFPFQLGPASGDKPSLASTYSILAEKGDVVLLGTDGLFDNVFDEQILEIMEEEEEAWGVTDLDRVAMKLATQAFEVAQSLSIETPFERAALSYGKVYNGGKMDDITVLLAVVD